MAPPGRPGDGAGRTGRIPGVVHFPDLLQGDGRFKAPEDMRRMFQAHGVTPQREIVVYCRLSHRASLGDFALTQVLGYPRARNYDGSWTEWGIVFDVAIER